MPAKLGMNNASTYNKAEIFEYLMILKENKRTTPGFGRIYVRIYVQAELILMPINIVDEVIMRLFTDMNLLLGITLFSHWGRIFVVLFSKMNTISTSSCK